MSFWRSQTMGYYNLVVPRESAWNVMNELAELDCIHYIDHDPLLPIINRPFANYIKRCDDLLNKISFIETELRKYKKKITYCSDVKELTSHFKSVLRNRNQASHTYFQELEADVEKRCNFLQDQTRNLETLCERRNTLIEHRAILLKGVQILGPSFFQQRSYSSDSNVNISGKGFEDLRSLQQTVKLNQLIGAIKKEDEIRFERIIFRVTKGNIMISLIDIDQQMLSGNEQIIDPKDDKPILKTVFVLLYPGSGQGIQSKIGKIIENFGANRYEFPDNTQQYQKLLSDIESQLNETKNLIALTRNQIDSYVDDFSKVFSNCSLIEELKLYIVREKYLYSHLNLMKMQGSIFCGYMWLPEGGEIQVQRILRSVQQQFESLPSGQLQTAPLEGKQTPPTYFKLNDFTWTFQEIVNTYGIPRYKEINPGLFTCVTFPFLFGVMFGDIGHGLCLFMFGIYLILYNHQISKSDSLLKQLLPARHMFTMMGFFAFYNGWIYNDFISLAIDLFGSCYKLDDNKVWIKTPGCTYSFGLDPVWSVSTNELTFVNSYKMKLSVIIGVIHMSSGILLKGINSLYFRNWLDLIFEFVPQIVFMMCTFGFMDYLIVYKWLHVYDPSQAPSIITLLIGMALQPLTPVDPPLWANGQTEQQFSLTMLLTAMVCVPIMLFPKPLILNYMHSKPNHEYQQLDKSVNSNSNIPLLDHKEYNIQDEQKDNEGESIKQRNQVEDTHHDFGEIFVHQVIETIEFVLGSISNTASYLRLWALSLAHGQLSEVFFGMTLSGSINSGGFGGFFGLLIGYVIFSMVTFGVLMMMDVMECFLHALRLHWVEFQNKFYKADGYIFVPYSYAVVLKEAAQPPPS